MRRARGVFLRSPPRTPQALPSRTPLPHSPTGGSISTLLLTSGSRSTLAPIFTWPFLAHLVRF